MTTLEELREEAAELEIPGRSNMNKDELEKAVAEAKASLESQDEGSQVSEGDQASLEQTSDDVAAAAGVDDQGETGTPVDVASDEDGETSTGRGVGFRR